MAPPLVKGVALLVHNHPDRASDQWMWTPELNRWVGLEAVKLFGAARCMWASNYPVDGLVASFAEILSGTRAITAGMPRADRLRLFHGTAAETYRLDGR